MPSATVLASMIRPAHDPYAGMPAATRSRTGASRSTARASLYGVVVKGRGLHDRLGSLRGVARLEDAGADEDSLGAELHHHRRIGGRRDTTGGEQHDRQFAGLGNLAHQLVRRLQFLCSYVQFVFW